MVCLTRLDVWLDQAADDYRNLLSFATLVDWFFGILDALDVDALPALKALAQCAGAGRDSQFHQAFAI